MDGFSGFLDGFGPFGVPVGLLTQTPNFYHTALTRRIDPRYPGALANSFVSFFCFFLGPPFWAGTLGPLKSCASSGFSWQGPLFSGKRGSFFLSHVLAVVLPGRGLCFLEKRGPWISGRRRRSRRNNSGFWPGPLPSRPGME